MRQGQQPEYSLDWILANIAAKIGRISQLLGARGSGAIALLAVVVVGGIWLVSGIYSVEPSEQAALRLFGKYDTTVEPGLHWYWPWPVDLPWLFSNPYETIYTRSIWQSCSSNVYFSYYCYRNNLEI